MVAWMKILGWRQLGSAATLLCCAHQYFTELHQSSQLKIISSKLLQFLLATVSLLWTLWLASARSLPPTGVRTCFKRGLSPSRRPQELEPLPLTHCVSNITSWSCGLLWLCLFNWLLIEQYKAVSCVSLILSWFEGCVSVLCHQSELPAEIYWYS